ncbi:MAG: hypothetical protein ACREXR_00575, partial [Gammaproteobacteria bacterium]
MPLEDPALPGQETMLPPNGMGTAPPRVGGTEVEAALKDRQSEIDATHPELVNLASYLKPEELALIGEECLEDFRDDEISRADWMNMHAFWVKLYYQKDKPLNPPWTGSSCESIPILAEGCTQFHSRAYKAFFGRPGFIKAAPIGKIDKAAQDRAERVGNYMAWQLEVKDKSYKRNKDRLLRSLPLHGSFFTKVYRDPVRHRNVIENVRAIDLVVPYGYQATNVEDMDRKSQIIMMHLRLAQTYVKSGYFVSMPEPFAPGEMSVVQSALDDALGVRENPASKTRPAKIIEQHRYLDLNKDGVSEPYIVWVDCQSRKVLRIAIRYDVDSLGMPLEDQEPIEFFTHYPFIENPDGFYALGQGHLTGDLN